MLIYKGVLNPFRYGKPHILKLKKGNKHLVYTYKAFGKITYLITVEKYAYDVYVVKFCDLKDKKSPNRFCKMTNVFEARRLLDTVVHIGKEIFDINSLASFAFIGNPSPKEYSEKYYHKTKRYRVYATICSYFFEPNTFLHSYRDDLSAYLLVNSMALSKDIDRKEKIEVMFKKLLSDSEFGLQLGNQELCVA